MKWSSSNTPFPALVLFILTARFLYLCFFLSLAGLKLEELTTIKQFYAKIRICLISDDGCGVCSFKLKGLCRSNLIKPRPHSPH